MELPLQNSPESDEKSRQLWTIYNGSRECRINGALNHGLDSYLGATHMVTTRPCGKG